MAGQKLSQVRSPEILRYLQIPHKNWSLTLAASAGNHAQGVAIAARALRPDIKIIGVQAAGAAGCQASLNAGELQTLPTIMTIADGIAVKRPGTLTFSIISQLVDEVVVVDDEAIISAVLFLMERNKMLVEGAGAAGVAALLNGTIALPGKKCWCH